MERLSLWHYQSHLHVTSSVDNVGMLDRASPPLRYIKTRWLPPSMQAILLAIYRLSGYWRLVGMFQSMYGNGLGGLDDSLGRDGQTRSSQDRYRPTHFWSDSSLYPTRVGFGFHFQFMMVDSVDSVLEHIQVGWTNRLNRFRTDFYYVV